MAINVLEYDKRVASFAEERGKTGLTRLAIYGTGNPADGFCLCREWGFGVQLYGIVWERSSSPGEDAIWFGRHDVAPMRAALEVIA